MTSALTTEDRRVVATASASSYAPDPAPSSRSTR